MAVQVRPVLTNDKTTVQQLAEQLAGIFSDLIDQLNRDPLDLAGINTITEDLKNLNDKLITATKDIVTLKSTATTQAATLTALQDTLTALSSTVTAGLATKLTKHNTEFLGLITNTGTGISNFPNSGDWGFQNNAGTLTLRFNVSGTVKEEILT